MNQPAMPSSVSASSSVPFASTLLEAGVAAATAATGVAATGAAAGGVGALVAGANSDGAPLPAACGFADAVTSEATAFCGPGRTSHIPSAIKHAVATAAAPAHINGELITLRGVCDIEIPGCDI